MANLCLSAMVGFHILPADAQPTAGVVPAALGGMLPFWLWVNAISGWRAPKATKAPHDRIETLPLWLQQEAAEAEDLKELSQGRHGAIK